MTVPKHPLIVHFRYLECNSETFQKKKFQKFNNAIQDQLSQEVNREIQSAMINGLRQLYKPSVNLKMVDQIVSNLQ